MPKFRIASRGGTTLTKIGAALKGTYSGIDSNGKIVTQEAISKAVFENGVYSMETWPIAEPEIQDANSLILTVEADSPSSKFYVNTSLEYKLTKVPFKDPKSGEIGFRIEGLPNAVTIVLTEVPRTIEEQETRMTDINSTIIASAIKKVKVT